MASSGSPSAPQGHQQPTLLARASRATPQETPASLEPREASSRESRVFGAAPAPGASPLARAWYAMAGATALICTAVVLRPAAVVSSIEAEAEAHARGESGPNQKGGATAAAAGSAEPLATAEPKGATAIELEQARAKGLPGLLALASRFPEDPAVLRALLFAQANDRTATAQAVATAGLLLAASEKAARDPLVVDVLANAAVGVGPTAATALDLLVTKAGPTGFDRVFALATNTSATPAARDRAEALLAKASFRAVASPAALVADDLRRAKPCDRKNLFTRARGAGDARALEYLKPLTVTNGCKSGLFGLGGRSDCFSCLGNRAGLDEAIMAVETRAAMSPR